MSSSPETPSPSPDAAAPHAGIGRSREALLLAALALYAAVMWVWGAGRPDITHAMEAARASGARDMLRTGDYLIPRLGGRYNLAKPPLFHWAVAGVSRLAGGVTEATVRLPSALAAFGILVLLYFAARPVLGWQTAFVSAIAGATVPMVFGEATAGQVDMLLALTVAIALFAAFHMLEAGRAAWLYAALCGLGLAMGVLAKGPIIPLFLVPTAALYAGLRREGDLLAQPRWAAAYLAVTALLLWLAMVVSKAFGAAGAPAYLLPLGLLVYFAVRGGASRRSALLWTTAGAIAVLAILPWALLAVGRIGLTPLWAALKDQSLDLRTSQVTQTNHEPIWYYLVALPLGTLPYSLFVPLAFSRRYAAGAAPRERRLLLFAACWLAASAVVFTLCSPARKLRYLLPVFPAVALLAGDVLTRGLRQTLAPWMNRYVRLAGAGILYLLCLAPAALLGAWFAMRLSSSAWALTMMAGVAAAGAAMGLCLRHVRRTPWAFLAALAFAVVVPKIILRRAPAAWLAPWYALWATFSPWVFLLAGVVAAAGAAVGLYLRHVRRAPWAFLAALALVMVGPKILLHFGPSQAPGQGASPRAACLRIRELVPPGEKLYLAGEEHATVVFYLEPEPQDAREVLRREGTALVCVAGRKRGASGWPPTGCRAVELGRTAWGTVELRLLRVSQETSD